MNFSFKINIKTILMKAYYSKEIIFLPKILLDKITNIQNKKMKTYCNLAIKIKAKLAKMSRIKIPNYKFSKIP